jgi:putative peptidoglycan lipid II flippase
MPLTRPLLSQLWSSTLMVVGLALLAKLCGALKEISLAHHLGTSALVDQFVFAFSVATWPAAVAGSILTIALTPLLTKLQRRNDSTTKNFMAQLWGGSVALSVLVALVFGCVFPNLSPLAASGGARLAVMVGVVTFLSCLTTLVTIILMCHGRQIGTLLEGLPSLTLGILLVLGLWPHDATLVYGLVLGMALQLGILWVVHHRHIGAVSLAAPQAGPQWTALGTGLGYTTAGYAILSAAPMIELWVASGFETGSVASLGYAARITALATGLIVTAVNRVAIVHFCNLHSKRISGAQVWLGVVGWFSLGSFVSSLVLIYFSNELVSLIFQRGRFDAAAADTVSQLMRWSVAQLTPYVATAVLCAYLSAIGGFKQIFIACLLCFVGQVGCAVVGSQQHGLTAIAAAPLVGHVLMLGYLLIAVSKRAAPSLVAPSSLQT